MNFGDFFRSFFERRGFRREYDNDLGEQHDHDDMSDMFHGDEDTDHIDANIYSFSFGGDGRSHSWPGTHFGDIFHKFEEFFHSMAELPDMRGVPVEKQPEERSRSARDHMLKQPDRSPDSSHSDPATSTQPHSPHSAVPFFDFFQFGSLFDPRIPKYPQEPVEKEDTDLDEKVKSGDLSDILKSDQDHSHMDSNMIPHNPRHGSDHIHRAQVYSYKSANGMSIERKTVSDDASGEVTTVTQSLGDQSYSITTKTAPDGTQHQTENFVNISEDEREDFRRRCRISAAQDSIVHDKVPPQSLVKDLFRFTFPGFPSG